MIPSMIQISPLTGGVVAGVLHVIMGPDHLCTIVTLSACQGAEAFWFGVRWAGGHLSGMLVIGLLIAGLNHHYHGHFDFETYEHYALYCVGFMLMFIGGYFILFADKYFDEEWNPRQGSCACHADHQAEAKLLSNDRDNSSYGSSHADIADFKKSHGVKPIHDFREMGSVLVGFVQGIACPAGVVGMVFMKEYNLAEMCIFLTIFFIVTTLAMGLLAMTYGMLTRSCVSSAVLGRTIYYASCGLSLTLGAAWIVLNANYRLEAWLGHDHDHSHHGHDHSHDHSHAHSHAHAMMQEVFPSRLPDLFMKPH
jgi:ABC-type nickel/cobalt efflux system permease component RcnA